MPVTANLAIEELQSAEGFSVFFILPKNITMHCRRIWYNKSQSYERWKLMEQRNTAGKSSR